VFFALDFQLPDLFQMEKSEGHQPDDVNRPLSTYLPLILADSKNRQETFRPLCTSWGVGPRHKDLFRIGVDILLSKSPPKKHCINQLQLRYASTRVEYLQQSEMLRKSALVSSNFQKISLWNVVLQ
jgi:hypothetical protein